MKYFFLGFLMAALLGGGAYWFYVHPGEGGQAATENKAQKYHCPMHPTYVSDKPGACPICGMDLVPIGQSEEHAGHPSSHGAEESQVPGYTTVNINPERVQVMGITLDEARTVDLNESIRTYGRVTYDETRLHHVHTKFDGFVEDLYVNYVGQFVKKGQPLFSIYSPELYATQKEYLLALKAENHLKPLAGKGEELVVDLLGSARRRLALWDISDEQIAELERSRQPTKTLVVKSPVTGFVTGKTAVQGLRVMSGDTLYDIVDLSSVWVLADIYEVNLPVVRIGQPAEMTLAYNPGRKYRGRVTYIDPVMDEKTRTAKARLEFRNPSGELKPDMYADVALNVGGGKGLAVPEDAVIETGERNIVFVAKGDGVFEPREVTTGVKIRNLVVIQSGLQEGERVATGGNFLLDSESKLKAAISGSGTSHQHGS